MSADTIPEGFTGEKHPEVYERPPRSNTQKPGQLSDSQLDEYYEKGYTLVKDFFTHEELDTARSGVERLVTQLADRLHDAGKIRSKYEDSGLFERLTKIDEEFPGSTVILHKYGRFIPEFQTLAANERILNLLEDLIGPDIAFSPVWNLRTKTPNSVSANVPWHQDAAYGDDNACKMHIVTAWIPLVDANLENGTLQMVRNAHRDALVAMHTCCAGPTWYVMLDEKEMESRLGVNSEQDIETVEVPYGSFLLFNNFTPHCSLPNNSKIIRWSLDYRWQKAGAPDGLFGLKSPCVLRRGGQPDFVPDWETFANVDRHAAQMKLIGNMQEEFSTVNAGPWMRRWHITNENRHTAAFNKDPTIINLG